MAPAMESYPIRSMRILALFSVALFYRCANADVSCGGHFAPTCPLCPQGNGAAWCNGDCFWDLTTDTCQPNAEVSCGGHFAPTCQLCPQGNGAAWCNGDCSWDPTTDTCQPPSINCGSGQSARTCSDCPIGSCEEDCTWQSHTSLCREAFSDNVRTASVHLFYDKPSSLSQPAWWFQRVIPTASADATYFSSSAHQYGYGGIQQGNEEFGYILFSLWDQGGCDQDIDPTCNPADIAQTVACGEGVVCQDFGGEGTGRTSSIQVSNQGFPIVGQEYYFVTQAAYLGDRRMEYTGYFYLNGKWKLLSRIQVSTDGNEEWWLTDLYSFVEQWSAVDTTKDRGALYGPSFMAPSDGSVWHQIPNGTFGYGTFENHERVNAWQEGEGPLEGAIGIETGGNAERTASYGDKFDYPTSAAYPLLNSFATKVPCLNTASTTEEIEACLIEMPSPPPTSSCSDSTDPFMAEGWTKAMTCERLANRNSTPWKCANIDGVKEACPLTCLNCCQETTEKFKLWNGKTRDCEWASENVEARCKKPPTMTMCPITCGEC